MVEQPVVRGPEGIRSPRDQEHSEWGLAMKLEQFVEEFAQNVSAQTDAILRGDAKAGNRHATRYVKAFKKLRQQGDAGRDALAVLLSHPRMDVRVAAAACLLRHRTTEAQGILAQAAAG